MGEAINLDDLLDELEPHLQADRATKMADRRSKRAILALILGVAASPQEAGAQQGLHPRSLGNLLRKPTGKRLRRQLHMALREGWAEKAEATMAQIMLHGEKASDRMRAAEWIAGIAGIAPVKRSEIKSIAAPQAVGIIIVDPRGGRQEGE